MISEDTSDVEMEDANNSLQDQSNISSLNPISVKNELNEQLIPQDENTPVDDKLDEKNQLKVVALEPEKPSTASTPASFKHENYKLEETFQERLIIDKLVLVNFKSYAGKQLVGPFHSSFSAVVGPNGSGKSNVIDSLLFVFGFRATKMRQSKLSELIHNSENYPNLPFCQVDIYFKSVIDSYDQNGEIVTHEIEKSELLVSRKAYRNNSSDYYINNSKSTYSAVQDLLKNKGIDLDHKRFLILQGEVESIAQMKPKADNNNDDGLLEYLEDIIGTSKYKATIEENLTRIDELNDICINKENRFKIVETAKNDLEDGKNQALEYLKMEKQLIIKKSIYSQVILMKGNNSLAENESKLNDLKKALEDEKKLSSKFDNEIENLNEKYESFNKQVKTIEKKITDLKNVHKSIEKEKVSMDEKIKHNETRKKKATKSLESNKNSLRTNENKIKVIEENKVEYTKQIDELNNNLEIEKAELEQIKLQLSDKTKSLSIEIDKLQRQLQPKKEKNIIKQGEIDLKNSEIQLNESKLKEIQDDYKQSSEKVAEVSELINSKSKHISHLKKEQAHTAEQIKLGTAEINGVKGKLKMMENELLSLKQKTNDSKSRVSSTISRNRVLSQLTHLKDSGRLNGFYGRLGDLGVIDDKYDIAVSTGGGSLDDMVVDTVETAQQCIQYMRKNNLGQGRFIALDKLKKFNLNKISTPKNTVRLFDLIKPVDPKFLPAFYSSMYDTLVANNMKEASKVAFSSGNKRWRVVTLDGKLVDVSGTLSGGGQRQFSGAMKLSSNTKSAENEITEFELNKMISELAQKEEVFSNAFGAFQEMEVELNKFIEREPEIATDISKLQLEIKSLNEELKLAKTKLNELDSNDNKIQDDLVNEIKKIKTGIQFLEKEKEQLEKPCKLLEDQIQNLNQKIMEAGGLQLKMQTSKVDSVLQKLEIVNQQESNDSYEFTKLNNQIKRLTKQINDGEGEINNCNEEIEEIRKIYNLKIESFERSEAEINDLTEKKNELVESCESIKEELDVKQSEASELKKQELVLLADKEKLESKIKNNKHVIEEQQAAIKKIEYRDVGSILNWLEEDDPNKLELLQVNLNEEYTPEQLKDIDFGELKVEIEEAEEQIDKTPVDMTVLEEYSTRFIEFKTRKNDLNDSIETRDSLKKICEELIKKRLDEFMTGFHIISSTLKEMYQMITMGGNAELELVDSMDPFSEGILFSVMPPKKSWKNISNLSGGEKTLSSLALVFALHRYKPTPLYVMDEIDAALDFRNVSIVANYIKERTKNAQFIVISLRNNMFELSKQLVGIYKVNNMTKSIALQNKVIMDD